jgi:hypothetical protein
MLVDAFEPQMRSVAFWIFGYCLHLIDQKTVRSDSHHPAKTSINFSLDAVHAILHGQLQVFTHERLRMLLHQEKGAQAHECGNCNQDASCDQKNSLSMIF